MIGNGSTGCEEWPIRRKMAGKKDDSDKGDIRYTVRTSPEKKLNVKGSAIQANVRCSLQVASCFRGAKIVQWQQ